MNTDTDQRDVVVMTIRLLTGPDAGVSDIEKEELFTDYEQILFTRVVSVAERHGRAVKLLVVPATGNTPTASTELVNGRRSGTKNSRVSVTN